MFLGKSWPCTLAAFNSPIKIGYILITVPNLFVFSRKEKVSTRVIFKELNQFALSNFLSLAVMTIAQSVS